MNRILSLLPTILVLSLTSCRTSYIDSLHKARVRIHYAVNEDGTLQQNNLNAGSNIAMHLAIDEAIYWEGKLMEMGVDVPDWRKRFEEIANKPTGFEGGSMTPLVRHMRLYEYVDGIAAKLKTMYLQKEQRGCREELPAGFSFKCAGAEEFQDVPSTLEGARSPGWVHSTMKCLWDSGAGRRVSSMATLLSFFQQ